MEIVTIEEMHTPAKKSRATQETKKSAAYSYQVAPTASPPKPRGFSLPPLPAATVDFSTDDAYRGVTPTQDKVLDALHRDGWTLQRLYTSPSAALPLPTGKFPPGRAYLFSDTVAVVVNRANGSIITSLPAIAALKTLNQYTPDVLVNDEWASERWAGFLESADEDDTELVPRWWKQSWFDRKGSIWTVRRSREGGARIYRDGEFQHEVADDDEAEDLDLHPITVELVAYVIGNEGDAD